MATEPQHSETMSGETTSSANASDLRPDAPAAAAQPDVGADAALIVEALGRMDAAIRSERAMLDRLRTGLSEMAQAVAQAKAVADSETAALLLDEFEHRIDAMIEITGGAGPAAIAPVSPAPIVEPPQAIAALPEPPAALEDDQVPTVSGVVSRLGPDPDPFNEAVVRALQSAEGGEDRGPSVAMLKAMVEALSVEAPAAAAEPEVTVAIAELEVAASKAQQAEATIAAPEPAHAANDPAEAPATAEIQEISQELAKEPAPEIAAFAAEFAEPPRDEPAQPPAEAAMPEVAAAEPAAEPAPSTWPGDAVVREGLLLASLEQMGSRPFQTSDEGTAVIFTVPVEPEPAPDAALAPEPVPLEPEQAGAPSPEPEPVAMAAVEPLATETIAPAPPVPAPPAPEPAHAPADQNFDPTDFLFGPEPEPDPAAFLLEPAPQPPVHRPIALPEPEFVSPAEAPPEAMQPAASHDQPAQPAPHDPLHALKAMSPEEKIALFT